MRYLTRNFRKIIIASLLVNSLFVSSDEEPFILPPSQPEESYVYKQTPQGELKIHFNFPSDWKLEDKRPAIVFFFGGGWVGGSIDQFAYQAAYFAQRGLVVARADYRVHSRHATSATECVEDAKSAVRWLREKAFTLGIDENRIVAAGGSAGAHIAACAYTVDGYDAPTENAAVSSKPNLLVLFNPVLDVLAPRWSKRVDSPETAKAISPLHTWSEETPPAILFFGKDDSLFAPAVELMKTARDLKAPVTLYTADGERHGFFNKQPWLDKTLFLADQFLIDNGYLDGEPLNAPSPLAAMTKYDSDESNADESIKTGVYQAHYNDHHPLANVVELNKRFRLGIKLRAIGPKPQLYAYDIGDESFEVYVPEDYDAKTPYGLLVNISPSESGKPPWEELPEELKDRKMIFIGANNSGNRHDVFVRRVPLALDAAHNIQKRYNIDEDRVFVFGISGGGRTSSMTAFHHPDVWKGAAFIIGVNYWDDMRNPEETRVKWKSSFNKPEPQYLRMAAENGRYVFLTGDHDGNRAQTRYYYERGYSKLLNNAIYLQVPDMGHQRPPFEWMLKTLDYIDPQK
ncbi:MAG: alpha/beta hydrolase fold domain-containing protein [Candidatus Hinthialibacter antarcticus]|nr:alpha/beta hydrolase fold domain-containing protein [Candidatus Hinthialibacter antarcticus]